MTKCLSTKEGKYVLLLKKACKACAHWGRESPAAMSLRHTETNLRHSEASLPDRHTEHEPLPYSTRGSAIQNEFVNPLFYVYHKVFFKISMQW